MPKSQKDAVLQYRKRLKREGIVRLEVKVRQDDAALVRSVAAALADPQQAAQARALLSEHFTAPAARGLKALLAAAPLDGIELSREGDTGRDVEL